MTKRLYKKSDSAFICGVCSGLADYLDTDVSLIRLGTAILALGSLGSMALIYLLAATILPDKNEL